jgi:diadenosine tetraphosphatase ApaH/serine/threonine PP2A family protein phosphatase
MIIANTGSVSLSYDGDPRASYLLVNDSTPEIRRVEYDIDRETRLLRNKKIPHAEWLAKILTTATFQNP